MTIYLVRHGETCWNRDKRLQGQKDSPLTLRGITQVQAFGRLLASELAGQAFELHASTLPRAQQSASIIAEALGYDWERVQHEPRLKERNQGLWDGLNAREIEVGFSPDPKLRRTWDFAAPEGETLSALQLRIRAWLDERADAGGTVVAVCHGVVSRVMRGTYLGLPPEQILRLPGHEQDRIYKLTDGELHELVVPG